MRHSVLITGKNQIIKEEMFSRFAADFKCFTCSAYNEDIKNHLNAISPDVMVCCLQDEEESGPQPIRELQELLEKKETILVAAGSKEDCGFFTSCAPKLAKFVFEKPLNINMVFDCLVEFFDKKDIDNLLNQINALEGKKSVMVIDDDPFMQKLMVEYLKKDYIVETAGSGKEALAQLADKSVDLILLDYEMPDESGPEVLERLHQNEATQDIPVIFLTSIMYQDMIKKALLLKPQGYLLKPVNREKLLEAINNLLG